jgi:hypothetical protein
MVIILTTFHKELYKHAAANRIILKCYRGRLNILRNMQNFYEDSKYIFTDLPSNYKCKVRKKNAYFNVTANHSTGETPLQKSDLYFYRVMNSKTERSCYITSYCFWKNLSPLT